MPVIYQDDSRVQTLNKRVFERNIPDTILQSYFDPRPQNTKYHRFPLKDRVVKNSFPIVKRNDFQPRVHFNPGTFSPFEGKLTNIDSESRVKNMFMSNQKYGNQNVFIPSSTSDLYINDIHKYSKVNPEYTNVHPFLQNQNEFASFNPDTYHINNNVIFQGHTRQKLKDIRI